MCFGFGSTVILYKHSGFPLWHDREKRVKDGLYLLHFVKLDGSPSCSIIGYCSLWWYTFLLILAILLV